MSEHTELEVKLPEISALLTVIAALTDDEVERAPSGVSWRTGTTRSALAGGDRQGPRVPSGRDDARARRWLQHRRGRTVRSR
jgi:hypothetical protein